MQTRRSFLLAAVNAQYIHAGLAVRSLKQYTERNTDIKINLSEYTINQHPESILRDIYRQQPEVIGLSCYIWNYDLVRRLIAELRQLLPDCLLVLGGPEVLLPEIALTDTNCDIVIYGEGERSFCELAARLARGEEWGGVKGIAFRTPGGVQINPPAAPLELSELAFPYAEGDEALSPEAGRIAYYEATRGCPYSCRYCLSGGAETPGKRVRFRPLPLVLADLDRLLHAGLPQVKFADRTFNCDKGYALTIWRHLAERDNGVTNFHFELAAELLDEEQLAFLNGVRPGLFQFEIGVQSTNPETLAAIQRVTLLEKLTPAVRRLQAGRNIHLHLDLIAGLPFEGYRRFGESFNTVWGLSPDQLQLGFLKLLKGSGLFYDREKYGLHHTVYPPYEVISTPWLSYGEILRLKMLAEMVERYANSHRYDRELDFLLGHLPSPFALFEALGDFYEARGFHRAPHAKTEYYTILREFAKTVLPDVAGRERFDWLARFDIHAAEPAKKLPEWMDGGLREQIREPAYRFLDHPENVARWLPEYAGMETRQLFRAVHIEAFPFHPLGGGEHPTVILFNYRAAHFPSGAKTTVIPIAGWESEGAFSVPANS